MCVATKRRKNVRLTEYDYSQAGYYFITICTKDKEHTLWVGSGIARLIPAGNSQIEYQLSPVGEIVRVAIEGIPNFYPNVVVDKYVIMPNHIHMILILTEVQAELRRAMPAPTISRIVNQMKGVVSKRAGFAIWQKSFYEHIILNEARYREIWQYINDNPAKRTTDEYFE